MAGTFAADSGVATAPAGTSTYDLLFNDVADRDLGHYKYGLKRPTIFWDRLNVALPNFHRWEQYLGAAIARSGKPAMVWQIPVGNQRFRTLNNTDGHYQDNRAEYFFEHIDELANIGVIGLLFGAGNGGSTALDDGKRDGVTNPPAFCTTDGISIGQICNNRESIYADDDGGFLRLAAADYYARGPRQIDGTIGVPVPPRTNPVPSNPQGPAPSASVAITLNGTSVSRPTARAGDQVTVSQTFTAQSDAQVLVDFELYSNSAQKVWQTWHSPVAASANQPTTDVATFTVPGDLPPGTYTFKVGIFGPDWDPLHAWNNEAGMITIAP